MRNLFVVSALLFLTQLSIGCEDDTNSDGGPQITISAATIGFDPSGEVVEGENSITVQNVDKWKFSVGNQTWCRANISSNDEDLVTFTIDKNTTTDARNATVLFYEANNIRNSVKLKITQSFGDAIHPELPVYLTSAFGGDITINVSANIDFQTAIPDEFKSWLTLKSSTEDQGAINYRVVINVGRHIGEQERLGKIVFESDEIDDVIVEIKQAKVDLSHLSLETANELIVAGLATRRSESLAQFGDEWDAKLLSHKNGIRKMKFNYKTFGDKPTDGRSLYISMHGGGATTAAANDEQWENQLDLYQPSEGIYFVPRSPTDTWDMWHQGYMDGFIEKIIELAVIKEEVNPNKVYIMGYSAGGDGTYQLAPRLADLWAGAAMSAGHPGDAKIENLRNLPFALYMGGDDAAYDRNKLAGEWGDRFDMLAKVDVGAYTHDVQIYPGIGHWMELRDNVSMTWLPQYTRNAIPTKVVWIQDDIIRSNFYWLEATAEGKKKGAKIIARYDSAKNEIHIDELSPKSVIICVNDNMMNLNKSVKLFLKNEMIFNDIIPRIKSNIDSDITRMRDADLIFPAKLRVNSDKTVDVLTD